MLYYTMISKRYFNLLKIYTSSEVIAKGQVTITIWEGSNKLIKIDDIPSEVDLILAGKGKKGKIPQYWDGETAARITKILSF